MKILLLTLFVCLLSLQSLFAAPPVVETIGLAPLSETSDKNLQVGFYITSAKPIAKVVLNGTDQPVTKGQRQITIFASLELQPGSNQILLEVTDSSGATSQTQYDVLLKDLALFQGSLLPEVKGYKLVLGLHQDDNPSLDMSSGVYEGVTPNDQQSSLRNLINVAALWGYLGFEGEVGYYRTRYSQYHPDLGIDRFYLGAYKDYSLGTGKDWLIAYQFQDENRGGFDYSMNHLFSTGIKFTSLNQYGQKQFALIKGNIKYRDFASEYRSDGIDINLMWNYKLISRDYLYSYESLFTLGHRNEGVPAFQHNYVAAELHWARRITPQFELDLGFDSEYRVYPDNPLSTSTALGSNHVDIPMELSLVAHWQYSPTWRVTGTGNYILSLSNKIPYDRRLYGVTIARDF